MKNVVVVDIDGVLCDYRMGLLFWIRQSWPDLAPVANQHLRVSDTWIDFKTMQVPYRNWLDVLKAFNMSGGHKSLPVFEGAREFLEGLKEEGKRIVLLTSRPQEMCPNIYGDTIDWLNFNTLPFDEIHWSRSKGEMVHRLYLLDRTILAVDDEEKHIMEYANLEIPTLHIDLYNKLPVLHTKPHIRVHSLLEYLEIKNEQPKS